MHDCPIQYRFLECHFNLIICFSSHVFLKIDFKMLISCDSNCKRTWPWRSCFSPFCWPSVTFKPGQRYLFVEGSLRLSPLIPHSLGYPRRLTGRPTCSPTGNDSFRDKLKRLLTALYYQTDLCEAKKGRETS